MKKIIITASAIIAGVAIAGPYFLGNEAEKRFVQSHERLKQEMVYPQLEIEAGEFRKGWFTSEATTRFTIKPQKPEAETVEFTLQHHIKQYPSPGEAGLMTIDSKLVLPPEAAEELKNYFSDEPALSAHSVIKFDGSEVSTITSPSYSGPIEGKEGAHIVWKGLEGTTYSNADMNDVTVSLQIPEFRYSEGEDNFVLAALRYDTELQRGEHDIWYGNATGSLDKLELNATSAKSGTTHFFMDGMEFVSEQRAEGTLVNMSGAISFDTAEVSGFRMENGVYDVAYNNLDAASLGKINQSFKEVMRQQPEDPRMMLAGMLPHVRGLLSSKPELNINKLNVDTPMGNIRGKMHLSLLEELTDGVMQNPAQVMQIMKVDIDASLPKMMVQGMVTGNARNAVLRAAKLKELELTPEEVAQQTNALAQQQIQGMLAQKLILDDGGNFSTSIHYVPQQLVINEQDATPMINGLLQ